MRPAWHLALAISLALVGASPRAAADGMRCGQRLVSKGDSLYEVRSLCGEPTDARRYVVTRTERRSVRGPCFRDRSGELRCRRDAEISVDVVVDEWTYDFGRQRFIRVLTFEDGRLVRVDTGGYGHAHSARGDNSLP